MKWLDPEDDGEAISIGKLLDGELPFENDDASVRDKSAEQVGKLEMVIDPYNFKPKWTLRVPADRWPHVRIVCDGNAMDVDTDKVSGDRYRVKRTVRGFRPMTVEEESILELPTFDTTKEFITWLEGQDTDTVEALRQIYYDRWCFDSASTRDKIYYELCEEEKKGRR